MAFRRFVIAVLLFVLVVGVSFAALEMTAAASDDGARTPEQVTNESISQQTSVWQFVNKATEDSTAGFNESVTVYNSSGTELEKGVDYHWNATDGTITYENTANVTDGETGNISYTYFKNTQQVNQVRAFLAPIITLVGNAPLMVAGLGLGILLLAAVATLAKYMSKDEGPTRNR